MICDPFGLFDCFDKLYYTQEFVECNKKISHAHKIEQILCVYIQIYTACPADHSKEKWAGLGAKGTE